MSGQGRLPGDVGLTRNLQPVMDAAGSGRTGQDLDEGELERIRQRVLREAEENFKLEIRKLRGEVGTDSRSYHSASSGGDQGAPSAAQGDSSFWSYYNSTSGDWSWLGSDVNSWTRRSRWCCGQWNASGRCSFSAWFGSTRWSSWCWSSRWFWGVAEEPGAPSHAGSGCGRGFISLWRLACTG